MFESLFTPNIPRAAIGFGNETVTAVSIQKEGRGQIGLRRAATVEIASGILEPSFDEPNIPDEYALVGLLQSLVVDAGLAGQKSWSASLPAATARSAIITLDEVPASKNELEDVLDWKAESAFGAPAQSMRVSRIRISPSANGKARYFAAAVKLEILDGYERVFGELGWRVGLILPRALGESNWFAGTTGDSLLISTQNDGFTALLMREKEPIVVRTVTCSHTELDDEIYRLLVYYQDRVSTGEDAKLSRLLILGNGLDTNRVDAITKEAMGTSLRMVGPSDVGFSVPVQNLNFDDLAAPAGLAALGIR